MVNEPEKCGRCNRTVYFAERKVAIKKVWHTFCFSCAVCHKLLDSCSLNTYQGELYCFVCFQNVSSYDVSDVEDGPVNINSKRSSIAEDNCSCVCKTSNPKFKEKNNSKKEEDEEEGEEGLQRMFNTPKSKKKRVSVEDPKTVKKKDNHPFGLGFFSSKKKAPPDKHLDKTQPEIFSTPLKSPINQKNGKSDKKSKNKNNSLDDPEDVFSTPMKPGKQEIDEMIQVPSRNDHKGCPDPPKCSKLCGPDKIYKDPVEKSSSKAPAERTSNKSKKPNKISSMEALASDVSDMSDKSLSLSKKDAKKNLKEPKQTKESRAAKSTAKKNGSKKKPSVSEEDSFEAHIDKNRLMQKNKSSKKGAKNGDDDFVMVNKPNKVTKSDLISDPDDFDFGLPVTSTPNKKGKSPSPVKTKDSGASGRDSLTQKQIKSVMGIKKKTSSNNVASSSSRGSFQCQKKGKNGSLATPRPSIENYPVKIQERIKYMESLIEKEPPYEDEIFTNKTNFKNCAEMHKNCTCHTSCENKCECTSLFCKKLNEVRQAEDGSTNPCQQDQCFAKTPRQVSGYYSRRNIADPLCESCFPKCKRLSPDICRRCNNRVYIVERMCAAGGVFHDCCFTCFICQRHLDSLKLVARRGEIFCKQCYLKYFGPHFYGYNMSPNIN